MSNDTNMLCVCVCMRVRAHACAHTRMCSHALNVNMGFNISNLSSSSRLHNVMVN